MNTIVPAGIRVAALMFLTMPALAAPPPAGTEALCTRLAALLKTPAALEESIHVPAVADPAYRLWPDPLYDFLEQELKKRVADDPDWNPVFEIEQLAGTPVVRGVSLLGSAHCVYSAYATVQPDGSIQPLPAPRSDTGVCLLPAPEAQGFGTMLGVPAHVQYTGTGPAADGVISVTPWEGEHWGQSCELRLKRRYEYEVTRQHCSNPAICYAARAGVQEIVADYVASRRGSGSGERRFQGEYSQTDDALLARAWHLIKSSPGKGRNDFTLPLFPVRRCEQCSYEEFPQWGFVLFRWLIDGHAYVGAVGQPDTVYWDPDAGKPLVALYAPPEANDQSLRPLAAFAIEPKRAGIEGAEIEMIE